MEKEKLNPFPSYVGPLAQAEDSADCFISGLVYSALLQKLAEQQLVINDALAMEPEPHQLAVLREEEATLEKVWLCLADTLASEC